VSTERGKRRVFIAVCLSFAILFTGLGVWQVQRLFWKLDLIERVDARVHAAPVPLPTNLDALRPQDIEYRRVRVNGRLQNDRQTFVDALTKLGPGDWVVTPLQTRSGTILINRGFVPKDMRDKVSSPAGDVAVTGLLRLSEPAGRFLRANRPAQDLWYSRDVAAIARRRGLGSTAPVFIDADATPNLGGYPVGGLTVVKFRNAHLVYALTWFGLAALCVAGLVLLLKPAQKRG
jgi:surfeit locus 1 family protein